MHGVWIEALEERALLSALAPSEVDPRKEPSVYLNVSPPPGTLIATESSPLNVLFDAKRNQLIVIEANEIERFDASDGSFVGSIATQSDLLAADISPDGQFLYVLNSWELRKINLDQPAAFKRINIPTSLDLNLFDVAVSADGVIVSQTDPDPSQKFNPVSRISLVDDSMEALVVKQDGRTFFDSPAILTRSADFSFVSMNSYHEDYWLDHGIVRGREDIFGPLYSIAVSRDGSLHALDTVWGAYFYNKQFQYLGLLAPSDYRVAFSPAEDVLFAAFPGNNRLVAYDSSTWKVLYSIGIPDEFRVLNRLGPGHMAVSANGQTLFLTVDNGVRMFDLSQRSLSYGQSITLGAGAFWKLHNSDVPTGTVTILDGGEPIWSGQLSRGYDAELTLHDLAVGTHWMGVEYSGDYQFQPGTANLVKVVVGPAQADVDLGVLGSGAVRVTVTSSTAVEGGTITLLEGDEVVKTVPLTSPTMDISFDLPAGPHALRAVYSGTENILGGRSQEQRVFVPYDATVTLTQSKAESIYSQQVVFTAKVSGGAGSTAGGYVMFFDGGDSVRVVPLDSSGQGALSLTMAAGEHEIHADFSGTSTLNPGKSGSITHRVGVATTTISLSATLSDNSTRVVAKVTASSGVAVNEGGVTFFSDGMAIDFLKVKNGEAVFNPDLIGGSHVLTASYVGNSSIAGSTSSAVAVKVPRGLVSLKLVPERNWTIAGNSIWWETSLNIRRPGGGYPEGQIIFYDGKRPFWGYDTDSREDVMRTTPPPLKAGEHRITAKYVPSGKNWAGASTTVKVTIAPATTIDLLVLYTYTARNDIGSDEDIRHTIEVAVEDTNEAMLNSHIPVRIALSGMVAVDYRESGKLDLDLERLANPNDHRLDEAQRLRKQYGADLVSLMEADGDLGGAAYELSDLKDSRNAARGYSVMLIQQAAGPVYTLAHELGHNLGATHDEENAAHPGATKYSHGYRFRAGHVLYHDIMSYDPGRTIQYYSNPRITFKGVPTGDADSADAARTITLTAPYVARYLKRPRGR